MQSLLVFPRPQEEYMPLRKDQQDFISAEIARQVGDAIDIFKPKGWKRITYWAREWGIAGAIITAFVGMLAITLGAIYQSFAHVKEETTFRTQTNDGIALIQKRLDEIEKALLLFRAPTSPKPVLEEITKLQAKDFAAALPALKVVAQQPISDVNPSEKTLREIADKLRHTDPNTPEYWPTVLRFLQFASSGLTANVPPPGRPTIELSHDEHFSLGEERNIRIKLDGGSLENSTIYNSRVMFTENPVVMTNVKFIDCVFDIPAPEKPSPYLQKVGQLLLASDINSATIPSLPRIKTR
jgi:hypothetical protein